MKDYLIDHAVRNVWQNPDQDRQLVFEAMKITALNGELNRFRLGQKKVNLPVTGKRYHVYQIGQISPALLGLVGLAAGWEPQRWISFQEPINRLKTVVNLYTDKGIRVPCFSSYYMYTDDKALIFCVEDDGSLPIDFNNEPIYLRFYRNAYFESSLSDSKKDYLYHYGIKIANTQDILDAQVLVGQYRSLPGYVVMYVNGFIVNALSALTIDVGDVVEFLYDSSVKKVVRFITDDLLVFHSVLDKGSKYLLHYADTDITGVDYIDDIDLHILSQEKNGNYLGAYFHRNAAGSQRMVTHRDYSISVSNYNYIATRLLELAQITDTGVRQYKLEMVIRQGGQKSSLIEENHRIFELYKLDDENIKQALVGVNSNAEAWKASVLEMSDYCKLMGSAYKDIDMALVQQAYGYNAISKIAGDTPQRLVAYSGQWTTTLPTGLQTNSTVYEYDENGLLLKTTYHATGAVFTATHAATRSIEAINGKANYKPTTVFGTNNLTLPVYDNYRVYMCFLKSGIPDDNWKDITDTTMYKVVAGKLVWTGEQYDQFLMVRSDASFLDYDLELTPVNGNLFFTLTEVEDRGQGDQSRAMPVPGGELDIWLNDRCLIEGLDYVVNFPTVYVINKKYLKLPFKTTIQKLHIRFTGFCDSDLNSLSQEDFGFIKEGLLSANDRFDLRDDKVIRITVDGKLKHRDEVVFAETHLGLGITNVSNGLPYQVKELIVPLKQLVGETVYTLRAKSMAIDKATSDYMGRFLPQPEKTEVSAIPNRYPVVSPFVSKVIEALLVDIIGPSVVESNLSDRQILDLMKDYEPVLRYDPIQFEKPLDEGYVRIEPHHYTGTVGLNLYQYRFLNRVVKLYAGEQIDLTPFVSLSR